MENLLLFWEIQAGIFTSAYVQADTYPAAIQAIVGAVTDLPDGAYVDTGSVTENTVCFSLGLQNGSRRMVRSSFAQVASARNALIGETIAGQEVVSAGIRNRLCRA